MMRNLLKWCVVLLFIPVISGCDQKSTAGFKPDSEPDGFAGIKWEKEFPEANAGMVESQVISNPAKPSEKIKVFYTRTGDDLKIGEARLEKREYGFWRGKFTDVRMIIAGPENFERVKKYLFETYGSVDKPVEGAYRWRGNVTEITLRDGGSARANVLTIASRNLAQKELQEIMDSDR